MTAGRERGATPGRGRFITFEGVEGSGKSTQIVRLAERLGSAGLDVVRTREPGGTALGRHLRAALLDPDAGSMDPMAELLLYAADRAQHIREIVRPALDRGAWVLSDRYLDATLAYQGHARGLGIDVVLAVHSHPPLELRPDRTILLDLSPEEGVRRARSRNAESGAASREGRFENETSEFHRRVREGYMLLVRAEPERFRVIDASGDAGVVAARVAEAMTDLVPVGNRG